MALVCRTALVDREGIQRRIDRHHQYAVDVRFLGDLLRYLSDADFADDGAVASSPREAKRIKESHFAMFISNGLFGSANAPRSAVAVQNGST